MKLTFAGATIALCLALTFQASAQETAKPANQPSQSDDRQILQEILLELKQLRATLAKTTVNQIRFQTTYEQYKAQQARVDSMSREMEFLKNQSASPSGLRVQGEELLKSQEERLLRTVDPQQRQSLERQIQSMKRTMESQDQREKRSKERLSDLELKLPLEQAKLNELNAELDRIKSDLNLLSQQ